MNRKIRERSDEELLAESRKGNAASFAELVRRYEPRIAATVHGLLGNCDEADDIGQETFIRFYQALKEFRGESSIGTYLTRIAINLSLNELKRRERKRLLFPRLTSENESKEPAIDQNFDHFEEVEMVHRALNSLKPKFRAVVVLRLMEGYSTEETAEILNIPTGTVLSRLMRAQKKLREQLHLYRKER